MADYEKMSREQLLKKLLSLQTKLEQLKQTDDNEAELLHELQVHQLELEVQNRELQEARNDLESSRDRYIDLFDFAPVGYFILDEQGIIQEANLTGANMFNTVRGLLIGLPFSGFVAGRDLATFFDFIKDVFMDKKKKTAEISLQSHDASPLEVRLEGIAIVDGRQDSTTCRVAALDITQRVRAEKQTQELLQENRRITQRLFEVQEMEDQRLARELHDELGQWLTAIQADAQVICNLSMDNHPAIYTSAQAIAEVVSQVHDVIRRIVYRLRVGLMDEVGLKESVQEQVRLWKNHHPQMHCELVMEGELDGLGETINIAVYRMIQECLTNVARHAQANHLSIQFYRKRGSKHRSDKVILAVADDGQGMDIQSQHQGLGLLGMRERALAAGGTFELDSAPGQGLRIKVCLPVVEKEA